MHPALQQDTLDPTIGIVFPASHLHHSSAAGGFGANSNSTNQGHQAGFLQDKLRQRFNQQEQPLESKGRTIISRIWPRSQYQREDKVLPYIISLANSQ